MIEIFMSLLLAGTMDSATIDQHRPLSPEEEEARKRKGAAMIEALQERAADEAVEAYKAERAERMKHPYRMEQLNGWREKP